jgi:hypothetical protein
MEWALVAAWLGSGIEGAQPRLRASGTSEGEGDGRREGGKAWLRLEITDAAGSSGAFFLSVRNRCAAGWGRWAAAVNGL